MLRGCLLYTSGLRSFSSNPQLAAKFTTAYIDGVHSQKVATTAKHFPGHGNVSTDSHTGLQMCIRDRDNIMDISYKIATLQKETIDDTLSLIDHDTLRRALNLIKTTDMIHFCGVSFSHLLGENFALKMSRIGKKVFISHLEQEYLYSTSLVSKNDMALIVSYSGALPIIKNMVDMYKAKNIPILAITSYGQSYLRSQADVTLTITTKEKMYSKIAGYSLSLIHI